MSTDHKSILLQVLKDWKKAPTSQLGTNSSGAYLGVWHDDVVKSMQDKVDLLNERGEGKE